MKASELRIGNWYYEFSIPKQVDASLIRKLERIEKKGKMAIDISDIFLTEEWLLKFGFKLGLNSSIHKRQDYDLENIINISCYSGEYQVFINGNLLVIKYVHQLQNLYFALTNTELINNT